MGRVRPLGSTFSMPLCTKGSTMGGWPPEAAAEATEEAVLNSLAAAHTVTGYKGNTRYSLTDLYLKDL